MKITADSSRLKIKLWCLQADIAERLDMLADWVDPERVVDKKRNDEAIRVLHDIARGKIKPEDAAGEAYAALY